MRRHEQAVLAIAARVTGSPADAEDVRQQVFLALFRTPPDGDGAAVNVGAWLRRCAANAAVDRVRRDARRRSAARRFAAEPPPTAAAPHDLPEARDEAARLRAALAELAPEQRAALALRFDGGLTFAEAAAALGEPISTVKSRTRTAIARLHGSLAAPPAPVGAARRD